MNDKTLLRKPKKAPCGCCELNNTMMCKPHHCKKYMKWKEEYLNKK